MLFFMLLVMLCLCASNLSKELKIAQIKGITLDSCGLKSFDSKPEIIHKSCFQWHQTIEEQKALREIKNGRHAKDGEFPYTVFIKDKSDEQFTGCSGALINELWILTAAHCLDRYEEDYKIYVGITAYPTNNSKFYEIDFKISHNRYDPESESALHEYDIGLIKLRNAIDRSDRNVANGVCLPAPDFKISFSELSVFSGWGWISDDVENNIGLMTTLVKLNERYSSDHAIILTTDISYGILCLSDSGGPLVQYVNGRAVLIGVLQMTSSATNETKNCGIINGIAFTSVTYFMEWIKDIILNN